MNISSAKALRAVATAAALCAGAVAQAAVIVDLFSDPPGNTAQVQATAIGANDVRQDGPYAATILGGYRDLSITKDNEVGGDTGGTAKARIAGGGLSISNDDKVVSTTVVTWDGSNAAGANGVARNITGLASADLSLGGTLSKFVATVTSADLGFSYKIRLWDMDGDYSELSAAVQFGIPSGSSYASHYDYSWFSLASGSYCDGSPSGPPPTCADPINQLAFSIIHTGGAIDFDKIGALQIVLYNDDTHASADFSLDSVDAVPEPTSIGLVGLALVGGAVASRRRRVSK